MYHGEYRFEKRLHRRRPMWGKAFVTLLCVLALGLGTAGGSLAYLAANTPALENRLTPGSVSCGVNETFDGKAKSDVTVTNTGNTDAYIRAAIAVTWQDEHGNVFSQRPEEGPGMDFFLSIGEGWSRGDDGYYYCLTPIAPGGATPVLIETCKPGSPDRAPEGYRLCVEILADAVQSSPEDAVLDAWGFVPGRG